jgi:hypothetical protein
LQGFLVLLNGLSELFLLVELITLVLNSLGLLLTSDLFLFFLRESRLLVFFAFFLFFFTFLGKFFLGLLASVLLLFLCLHLLGLHVHEIDAGQLLEHIHETWVHLHQLHHNLRVFLAHLERVTEFGILEITSNSGVCHKLHHGLRTKHTATVTSLSSCFFFAALLKTLLDLSIFWV